MTISSFCQLFSVEFCYINKEIMLNLTRNNSTNFLKKNEL